LDGNDRGACQVRLLVHATDPRNQQAALTGSGRLGPARSPSPGGGEGRRCHARAAPCLHVWLRAGGHSSLDGNDSSSQHLKAGDG
jgi:hypothetical protein